MPAPQVPGYSGTRLAAVRAELISAAWRATLLALVAAALGLAYNQLRADHVALAGYEPPSACTASEEAAAVTPISPTEVASLCGAADVVVADVRPEDRFQTGHVAGAIHLPCNASKDAARVADSLLEGKRMLVVYGESNEDARPVAESLLRRRADKSLEVRVLDGGFSAWFQSGFACSSGACEQCETLREP